MIRSDQGATLAKASVTSVCVDPETRDKVTVPDAFREAVRSFEEGLASFYADSFHGSQTANGETYDMYAFTAAHKTLPFGTLVEFEYNGKRAVASVQDRGPFTPGRMWDLGPGVVRTLGFSGVEPVHVEFVHAVAEGS